jgi:DNA repair protein RadB
MLSGGIEHGIITNFYGPAGSGKSNVALIAAVSCVAKGKKVIFIDTEGGFSPERLAQIVPNLDDIIKKIILIEPTSFREQHKTISEIKNIVAKENVGLVILDSLVTLYRLELSSETWQEVNQLLVQQLVTLSRLAKDKNIPILITNQVYSDLDGGIELSGRDIPKYLSKCLIELRRIGTGKREAIIRKHRSLPEGRRVQFQITNEGLEELKGFKLF